MNLISLHISYLLLTCRQVFVPGLGTFSTKYEPASFDAIDGLFYPSRIRIVYTDHQKGDENLLEDSLTRKMKLKDNEAGNLIKEYVCKIHTCINKNHYCRLDGIGYLFMQNNKKKLAFKDIFWNRLKVDVI